MESVGKIENSVVTEDSPEAPIYYPFAIDILRSKTPLYFDKGFEGKCFCAIIQGKQFRVDAHCWKCSRKSSCECKNYGIHVDGILEMETMEQIAQHILDTNPWRDTADFTITVTDARVRKAKEEDDLIIS